MYSIWKHSFSYVLYGSLLTHCISVLLERRMLDIPDETDPLPVSNSVMGEYNQAAVVSNTVPCSHIGRDILTRGGSAVDAIIATLLCEGLCGLQNMGIGGGSFMTIYKKDTQEAFSLDAREVAPILAHRDMFNENPYSASTGGKAIAIPGELMGYWEAHRKFGVLPWKELFQPAIEMCINGIPIDSRLAKAFTQSGIENEIMESPTLRQLLAPKGQLPKEGELLRIPMLARTLTIIANHPQGPKALYDGVLTNCFLADIQSVGGIITREDLANYRPIWREPIIRGLAGGYKMYTSPPPSSGAILAFILQSLEGELHPVPRFSTHNSIKIVEAFKYGYGLRSELADPMFSDTTKVLSKTANAFGYIDKVKAQINKIQQTVNDPNFYGGNYYIKDAGGTTNTIVLAPNGDAVVATSTINTLFGSMTASLSTGIILNNEMDDFSSPHIINSFGISPSPANFIEPRKRPTSSTTPTVITCPNGEPRILIGGAGGTHITTSSAQVIMNNLWFGMNIKQAVDMPRLHHQLLPMILKYEKGIPQNVINGLIKAKHEVKVMMPHSTVTAIAKFNGKVTAIYDYRRGGSTAGF